MWLTLISIVVAGALALAYKFFSNKSNSNVNGIRKIDTSIGVSKLDLFLGRKGIPEADDYAYKTIGSEKYCEITQMGNSLILLKETSVIKKILIKDFDHFADRRPFFSDTEMSFKKMLPSLEGDEWKGVRSSVSPTFTTGKIRRMMEYFNSVGQEWVQSFMEKAKANSNGFVAVDAHAASSQYAVDVIASAVFGMNAGAIKDSNSPFFRHGTRLSDFTKWQLLKFTIVVNFPKVAKMMKLKLLDMEALGFFEGILKQGLSARMSGDTSKRNDFLQLLVEAKKGELKAVGKDELDSFEKDAQIEGGEKKQSKQWLTEQVMNSQSLVFFFAGLTTTSNTITFAAYALAVHQDIQDKLRQEVDKIIKKDGTLDYDDVSGLVYLDMVLCEVLRKYPAAARLERKCVRDYDDGETGLVISKGTMVIIPIYSLHNDKQYYDNPDKFDPEHFSPDKKTQRNPYAYMPFGMGPRNCIGMRFALVETKVAIALLVHNFRIEPTEKTPIPMKGRWRGFGYVPPKELELKLTPLKHL